MADDGNDDIPPERDQRLFSGLTFFLTNLCPTKDHFRTLIECNGGKVCKTDKNADLIISDHLRSQGNVEKAISYKWIDACVQNRELVDTEEFYISTLQERTQSVSKKPAKKSAGSIKAQIAAAEGVGGYRAAGARIPFTTQDDNILLWWIEKESKLSGNKTYKELEVWCNRHGWQGWRERWVKTLSKESRYAQGPKPAKEFDITKVPGWKPGICRPGDGASTSLDNSGGAESEDEMIIDMRPEHVAAVNENLEGLLNAETEDDLDDIFNKIADRFPERSVDEFKEFYYRDFLPRFENINRKQSKGDVSSQEGVVPQDAKDEPALREETNEDDSDVHATEFSTQEQRSLFSRFDDIVWADNEEERLEVCQLVADEFHSHSAEELLDYALTKMKPIIKKLKGKGKLRLRDLEQAVLDALNHLEGNSRKDYENSLKETPSRRKQDTRFEKLGTSARKNAQSESRRPSASSQKKVAQTPSRGALLPQKSARKAAHTPPSGQVLVYSPERPNLIPPQPKSSFRSPNPGITNKVTPSSLSVRTAPPSAQNSPGTPTPRPRSTAKSLSLLDDDTDPVPPESSPVAEPPKQFTESIQEHLNSSQRSRKIPPSSPPGVIASSSVHDLPSKSPLKAMAPFYSSFLSSYDESDEIPYRPPMRAPASSVKKPARNLSSQPSTVKRRKTVGFDHKEMVVESTPERKMFPLPVLEPISSSIGQSSPAEAHRQDREYTQTTSPLAYKSRKRKAEERYKEITPPPDSQEIEAEIRFSSQDTIEEGEEEQPTVVDTEFVMIKEEEFEAEYEEAIKNGEYEPGDNYTDRTEEEEDYGQVDGDETQDDDEDTGNGTKIEKFIREEKNLDMQEDENSSQDEEIEMVEEVVEEIVSEDDGFEEEADPMEMDSLTNRNLGILADNSPIIAARQSVTPIIPDDSDDISDGDRTQTALESPSPMSQLSVGAANFLVDEITERMRGQYDLESGAIEMVMYATSCNEEVMHVVLKQLSEYQQKYGTLAGFIWPTMRGLWTVEDDKAVDHNAPQDEIARVYDKHGEELILARWDWLSGLDEKTQVSNMRSTPDLEGSVTPVRGSHAYHGLEAPSRENSVAPEDSETSREKSYDSEASATPRARRR